MEGKDYTINQNIDPYTGKLITNYYKQFGTLLHDDVTNRNDFSQMPTHGGQYS
jgi:hypothetical protein